MRSPIQCLPLGICSWNFSLLGEDFQAQSDFKLMSEQGRLQIRDKDYHILKHGPFSGRWTMEHGGRSILEGRKTNPLTRGFEIHGNHGTALLRPVSTFGRSMELSIHGRSALIEPAHPFTRRSSITGDWEDLETVLFAFWLTVILWRRRTRNAN
jgi:hypothetical protein